MDAVDLDVAMVNVTNGKDEEESNPASLMVNSKVDLESGG